MNSQKLALLARDNRAAQVFFTAYSTRRRALKETPLQEIINMAQRANVGLSPADVTAFFRGLEDAQCGQMLENAGRARFEWLVKSTLAAKIALQTPAPEAAETDSQLIIHTLRLRPDWSLSLALPPDFTLEEAARVCHFVRALPLAPAPNAPEPDASAGKTAN